MATLYELKNLACILVRILRVTDPDSRFGTLPPDDCEEPIEAIIAGSSWDPVAGEVSRLRNFNFRGLDPDIFQPSPAVWWRSMVDAADYLSLDSKNFPSELLLPSRAALVNGLREVGLAISQESAREFQSSAQRLLHDLEHSVDPSSVSLNGTEREFTAQEHVDQTRKTIQGRRLAEKCDMLRTLLFHHHFEFGESLVNAKPLSIADMVSKSNGQLANESDGWRTLKALFNPTGTGGGHGIYKTLLEKDPRLLHSKLCRDVWSNPASVEYRDDLHSEGRRL